MKYTFKCEIDYPNQPKTTITVETDAVALDDILRIVSGFLKAAGFVFDGELDLVIVEE